MAEPISMRTEDKVNIIKSFLKSDRVALKFVQLEKEYDRVSIDKILGDLGFSDQAKESYKKSVSEWVTDGGVLNDRFYKEYNDKVAELYSVFNKYKVMKRDASILDSIPVHESFDIKNTLECVADNMNLRYYLPEGYKVGVLDFEKESLQVSKLICVSESMPIPFTFIHEFTCGKCENTINALSDKEKPRCPTCQVLMKKVPGGSRSMTVYVSKIVYEGNHIDAISRTKLPMNQFDAAVIPMKNEDKYNLFIVAVGVPVPKEVPLVWSGGDRMVELIRFMDNIHKERIGKYVVGLDHIKMAIIQCRMAGLMGNTATQALIVGSPGCGKSTVTKFYSFTLTDKSAFRDATSVTHAGLLGSSEMVDILGSRSPIMQLGLLERYEMTVLDEFLDKSNEDLNTLKNALVNSTITSEKHNNKREVLRNAVILAPSNVPDSHMKSIKSAAQNLLPDFDDKAFNLRAMPSKLKEFFTSQFKNWRDGESYSFLDRFAFIFYIESTRKGVGVIENIVRSAEDRIPDVVLRSLLFTKSIDDYLRACVKIKFKYSDEFDTPNLDRLIKKYCVKGGNFSEGFGDDIHSLERINKYFRMMVECHVLINMRDHSTEEDYKWLDKFYSKLCNFVYTEDLYWDESTKEIKTVIGDVESSKRGEIRFYILDLISQAGKDGTSKDNIVSSCSLNGYNAEVAVSVLNEMASDNIIIFEPPNRYKVLSDRV